MKIRYKKRKHLWNLMLGLVWTTVGVLKLFDDGELAWFAYVYLFIGVFYLGICIYDYMYQYLTISDGRIKLNGLFENKWLNLSEINRIRKNTGSYTLEAGKERLAFRTKIIDPDSLSYLNSELEKLDVEWK